MNDYDKYINKLLDVNGLSSSNKNLSNLIRVYNIKIKRALFSNCNISGILKKENNEVTIYINKNEKLSRQRFTISYLLCKYLKAYLNYKEVKICHKKEDILNDDIYYNLACSLLIPFKSGICMYRKINYIGVPNSKIALIFSSASNFNTPIICAKTRIKFFSNYIKNGD